MEVISLDQARHFLREKPIRVNVIDRPRLTCELVCMEPDQQEARQSFDVSDNLYVVVEGTCLIRTGASEHTLGVHDALVVPPGVEHSLRNPGPERLTIMAFVAPKPARASEVRYPRQQRDFSGPRPAFRPRMEEGGESPMPTLDFEGDQVDEPNETGNGEAREQSGDRSFPERGSFTAPRPDVQGGRRDFNPRPPRREFSGGHESRGPRRDFSPRPLNDRPSFGSPRPPRRGFSGPPQPGGDARPPRRDFSDRPPRQGYADDTRPPRRDFSDRPAGDRPRGDRPAFPGAGGRPGGGRPPYGGQARGPRPFGNRPPPRRAPEESEQSESGGRRPPVSRDFYPRKPNQTGGSRPFSSPRPAPRTNRGGASSRPPGRPGGRPGGPGRGPGASRGGGSPRPTSRPNRPSSGPSGRRGPGRSGPRT